MKVMVIGDRDTVTGFRLAGAEGWHVDTRDEAVQALKGALESPDTGLVILTERCSRNLGEMVEAARRRLMPPLVEIPDRYGEPPEMGLAERVRHIIGV